MEFYTCPEVWVIRDVDEAALAWEAISVKYELLSESDERSAMTFSYFSDFT